LHVERGRRGHDPGLDVDDVVNREREGDGERRAGEAQTTRADRECIAAERVVTRDRDRRHL
jgi:hypothetical protein